MLGRLVGPVALLALALAGCHRLERPQPLPGQEETVARLLEGCSYGLEHILPGDYYFCEAASAYWGGRFSTARDNLESAAHWGSKPAQHALGVMYFNGDHAPMNRPLGVAWLAIAAERHQPAFEQVFISAYRTLNADERKQADTYWVDMKPKYGDAYAAARAKRRFDREMRALATAENFGGSVYLSGVTGGTEQAVSMVQRLKNEAYGYFAGYQTEVWVGDAELVPLGQAVKPAPPAKAN